MIRIFMDEISKEFNIEKKYITSSKDAEKVFGTAITILSNLSANSLGNLYRQYAHSNLELKQVLLHEFLNQFDNNFEHYLKETIKK